MLQTKKGLALNQAFGAVLVVVLIGVLVIIAIFLFATIGDTFNDISATTTNETQGWANVTGYALGNSSACNFNSPVLTTVLTETAGSGPEYNFTTGLGNFSTTAAGVVTNLSEYNITLMSNLSVSYTYNHGGSACTATDTMITQFGNYPVLVGLVGTIIFLGLVIGVLVASFVFGGRSGRV